MVILSSSSDTRYYLSRTKVYGERSEERNRPGGKKMPPDKLGASLLDWELDLPAQIHLLLPPPVRFLIAAVRASLGVPPDRGEHVAANLAILLGFLGPFVLA